MIDRTAQFQAVTDALSTTKSLRIASDTAVDQANAVRLSIPGLSNAYNNAKTVFLTDESQGAALSTTRAALLAAQEQDPILTSTAQQAYVAFTTQWTVLNQAVTNLLQDPGAVEQV